MLQRTALKTDRLKTDRPETDRLAALESARTAPRLPQFNRLEKTGSSNTQKKQREKRRSSFRSFRRLLLLLWGVVFAAVPFLDRSLLVPAELGSAPLAEALPAHGVAVSLLINPVQVDERVGLAVAEATNAASNRFSTALADLHVVIELLLVLVPPHVVRELGAHVLTA